MIVKYYHIYEKLQQTVTLTRFLFPIQIYLKVNTLFQIVDKYVINKGKRIIFPWIATVQSSSKSRPTIVFQLVPLFSSSYKFHR